MWILMLSLSLACTTPTDSAEPWYYQGTCDDGYMAYRDGEVKLVFHWESQCWAYEAVCLDPTYWHADEIQTCDDITVMYTFDNGTCFVAGSRCPGVDEDPSLVSSGGLCSEFFDAFAKGTYKAKYPECP